MQTKIVGVLYPGAMGISVAAAARRSGHTATWCSAGRSPATRQRAEGHKLLEISSMKEFCQACDVLISVCPPHAAVDIAEDVLASGFRGIYCDANAVAPDTVRRIAGLMGAAGVAFVDGGIIGGPAWEPGATWLYLSGGRAADIAELFSAGPFETAVIGAEPGKASALKMCYAAYTKGSTALITTILSAADKLDVWDELKTQWQCDFPELASSAEMRARRVTAKAWRFAGEMDEIAATFRSTGAPGEFHTAAAIVYRQLARFKDAPDLPALEDVLQAVRGG
jgi:3-hydroxyisobutyrate dehydrogenase-like beta-hydroxyacid dehydrogenase